MPNRECITNGRIRNEHQRAGLEKYNKYKKRWIRNDI